MPLTNEQKAKLQDYCQVESSEVYVDPDDFVCTTNVKAMTRFSIHGDEKIGCIKSHTWTTVLLINRQRGYAVVEEDGSMNFMDGWYYDQQGHRVH